MTLDIARLMLFPALMAFAAASDLFTMTISNRVSLALIAGFLALALLGGMGWHDMLMHIAAGALVLVVAFGCFAMGWVGGGDAKVVACVALWFGFDHLLEYLVYASLFGGALTLLLIQFRQWPLPYALADYNAGRSNVLRWKKGAAETNSTAFLEQMDFPRTREYAQKILARRQAYTNEFKPRQLALR